MSEYVCKKMCMRSKITVKLQNIPGSVAGSCETYERRAVSFQQLFQWDRNRCSAVANGCSDLLLGFGPADFDGIDALWARSGHQNNLLAMFFGIFSYWGCPCSFAVPEAKKESRLKGPWRVLYQLKKKSSRIQDYWYRTKWITTLKKPTGIKCISVQTCCGLLVVSCPVWVLLLVLPLLLLGLSCYLGGVSLGRGCLVLVVVFVVCLRSDLPEGRCRMLLGLSVALLLMMMRVARLKV